MASWICYATTYGFPTETLVKFCMAGSHFITDRKLEHEFATRADTRYVRLSLAVRASTWKLQRSGKTYHFAARASTQKLQA